MVALGDGELAGPLGGQGIDILEAVDAGLVEVFIDGLDPEACCSAAPQTAETKGSPVRERHSWARSW